MQFSKIAAAIFAGVQAVTAAPSLLHELVPAVQPRDVSGIVITEFQASCLLFGTQCV
jgi:hypothetical protein